MDAQVVELKQVGIVTAWGLDRDHRGRVTTRRLFLLVAIASGVLLPFTSHADVVYLKNGNRLSGEVESTTEHEVVVNIPGVGKLTLKKAEIASIQKSVGEGGSTEDARLIAASPFRLRKFENERGDISVQYLEGWYVKEEKYNNPYGVFLSREKVSNPEDKYKVGMTLFKFYHQSWYLGLNAHDVDGSLNRYLATYNDSLPDAQKHVGEKRELFVGGVKAMMEEVSFDVPEGYRHQMYLLASMKDDVLVVLMLEAPQLDFERYRQIFDEVINTANLFSSKEKPSDNAVLDREIEQLLLSAMSGKGAGDQMKILSVLGDAVAMSPSYAKTRFIVGGFFMHQARGATGESQQELLDHAEKELRLAIELYNKYSSAYEAHERSLNVSQAYFLLGDIYYFPYGKKAEAKGFYEKSLEYYEHDGAREALEKYY